MSPRWNWNAGFTTASLKNNNVVASLRQVLPKLLLATVAGLEGGISRGLTALTLTETDLTISVKLQESVPQECRTKKPKTPRRTHSLCVSRSSEKFQETPLRYAFLGSALKFTSLDRKIRQLSPKQSHRQAAAALNDLWGKVRQNDDDAMEFGHVFLTFYLQWITTKKS